MTSYVCCIPLYKGKLENNKVFVQLYTKFYDFNMYADFPCTYLYATVQMIHAHLPF